MIDQAPIPATAIVTPVQVNSTAPVWQPKTDKAIQPPAELALSQVEVSANNPCPFLRGLVAQGLLPNDKATPQQIADAIHQIQAGQDPDGQGRMKKLSTTAIKLIASNANGLNPSKALYHARNGVELDNLRGGPFDKRGAGSRILTQTGQYNAQELARLATFASPKTSLSGETELGLNYQQIQTMLNANAARAKNQKRLFDRMIMNGEFPVLLKVLGKQTQPQNGVSERYLAVGDVEKLFKDRQFPERIAKRINLAQH